MGDMGPTHSLTHLKATVPKAACIHRSENRLRLCRPPEGRVEAHTELADDLAASLRLVLQCIQKGLQGEAGQRRIAGDGLA